MRFTVAASGDFLIHSPVYARALELGGGRRYDFEPLLSAIKPYVERADLALCHVETPLVGGSPASYPVFRTPPSLAKAIKAAGWDACSTASNHSLDAGTAGVRSTIAALDGAGVKHTGTARSSSERGRTPIIHVKGVPVAFLSYTEMTNGFALPQPWSVNLARRERILSDARAARKRGARAVIVNLHWGDEYRTSPSAFQRRLARELLDSDLVTAIVGQHVHVVQPIRLSGGKAVVYGEGNLISNQTSACCPAGSQDGLIALLDLRAGREVTVERVRYVPIWVRHPDFKVLPVGDALSGRFADAGELRRSYRRTVSAAGSGGGVEPVPARLP